MRKPPVSLSLIAVTLLASGCVGLLDPTPGARLGVVVHYGEPAVVEVPDTVQRGAPFELSILTFGGGCVGMDRTDVTPGDMTADVRPYDVHSGAEVCTAEIRMLDHRVTVSFEQTGVAEIRFHGREMPADSVVTIVRMVVVE